jgi:hypothetical protein
MADVIDTVVVRVEADTSLFDRKLRDIKDQLENMRKIQLDINQTGNIGSGRSSSVGAGGAGLLAAGALGGASVARSFAENIADSTSQNLDKLSKSIAGNFSSAKVEVSEIGKELNKSADDILKMKDGISGSVEEAKFLVNNLKLVQAYAKKGTDELRAKSKEPFVKEDLRKHMTSTADSMDAGKVKNYKQLGKNLADIQKRFDAAKLTYTYSVKIKDNFAQVTANAKAFGNKMKGIALSIGASFKKAFNYIKIKALVAFGAGVAYTRKAIMSYAEEEKAIRNLGNAIEQYGESSTSIVPGLQKVASAMQDQTGIGDEITLQRMADLKLMGVETNKLEDAAKAVIGLTRAGIGEETAIRAVAAARLGDTGLLSRYIPALRSATTQAEKAAIVNNFVNKQYKSQKDELDTVLGRYNELKGRIGDFNEAVGKAISENTSLKDVMAQLSEKIKVLIASGKIKEWVDKTIEAGRRLIDWGVQFGGVIKKIVDYKFEIAILAMALGITKLGFAAAPTIKSIWGLSAALLGYSKSLGAASIAAATFKGIGVVAVFAAGAYVLKEYISRIDELKVSYNELTKSMSDLSSTEDTMFSKYGTRFSETVNMAREMYNSGDPKKMETIRRMYPKIVAEIERVRKATSAVNDEPIDIVGDGAGDELDKTIDKVNELKKALSQGSGATSIFDTIFEGANTLLSGTMTPLIASFGKGIEAYKEAMKGNMPSLAPIGSLGESIKSGDVKISTATAGSGQQSIYSQLINAIQTQTDTLNGTLLQIDKSVNRMAVVI